MEHILRRTLIDIAVKAAPVRKKSRRAREIYRMASVALQIATLIDKSRDRQQREG